MPSEEEAERDDAANAGIASAFQSTPAARRRLILDVGLRKIMRIAISFVACLVAALSIYVAVKVGSSTTAGAVLLNFGTSMADIVIAVAIIDALLERREKKHWTPARQIIARQVARTYSVCLNGSYQLFVPLLRPEESGSLPMPPFDSRLVFIRQIEKQIKRLQTIIDLNNAALDASLMSSVSTFLDVAELIEARIKFLVAIHHPKNKQADFICDDVCQMLRRLEGAAATFKSEYPEPWKDRTVVFEGLKPVDEVIAFLASAEYPRCPIFFAPEKYVHTANRVPFVFDIETMRRIPTKDLKTGITVQVYQAE